jgi:hypothetical protein
MKVMYYPKEVLQAQLPKEDGAFPYNQLATIIMLLTAVSLVFFVIDIAIVLVAVLSGFTWFFVVVFLLLSVKAANVVYWFKLVFSTVTDSNTYLILFGSFSGLFLISLFAYIVNLIVLTKDINVIIWNPYVIDMVLILMTNGISVIYLMNKTAGYTQMVYAVPRYY